jgi:hypothetical protein
MSRMFTFVVGEDDDGVPSKIPVHQEIIAQLSDPFRAMMAGSISEAQVGSTVWKSVSKNDFILFAYTGDYSVLKPVAKKLNDNDEKYCAEE